jgi:hypothetical protein
MGIDADTKEAIQEAVEQIVASSAAFACAAAGTMAVAAMIVTNYKNHGVTGDTEVIPTSDETTISKTEVAAEETEGKLSQDKVSAAAAEVSAERTDALALDAEATASDNGATAVRTKAGASDIEVKALKMT